jgi:hypothetical protein
MFSGDKLKEPEFQLKMSEVALTLCVLALLVIVVPGLLGAATAFTPFVLHTLIPVIVGAATGAIMLNSSANEKLYHSNN